ncbi:MAG: dihydroorotase, partial [Chitinophagales bacterium]
MKKIIRNAAIVSEGKIFYSDVLITHGRIERIAPQIEEAGFAQEISGEGKFLIPGIIDDQVHFREPG